ncbi:hypothetical protein VTO42DRAFT_7844 [Malbranchea cinnamomea]
MAAAAGKEGGWARRFVRLQRRFFRTALYMTGGFCAWKIFNEHLYQFQSCDGPSMFPTLHRYGDSLVISKLYKYGRGIQVGDIVVYRQPQFSRMMSAKRVLGMPGDYVVVDMPSEEGDSDVNEQLDMLQVPEGHVWVTGDNLPYSRDSREYGPVPMGLITGKVIARAYWFFPSWPRFERIENPFSKPPVETP